MQTFKLVNPEVIGQKSEITATDKMDAAKQAWDNISKNIVNNIEIFVFTH